MMDCELTNMVMIEDPETGKVLVQKRIKKYCGIAFPGGHVEDGESIYDSAIREIREETGYTIKNLKACGYIHWNHADGTKYFTYFYKTTDFSGDLIEETEEGPVFWVDPKEMAQMQLAPNMDRYLPMFSGNYAECYCREENGGWNMTYK